MSFEKNWPFIFMVWGGIIILFFYFLVETQFQQIDTLAEQKKSTEAQVLALRKKVKGLEQMQQELKGLKAMATTLEARLPSEKEIPDLLITIEDAAFPSESEILSLTPQALVPGEGFLQAPFSTSLKGTFYNILLFMNNLRHPPRLIQVKNFAFKKENDQAFTVQMNLSTYLLLKEGAPQ